MLTVWAAGVLPPCCAVEDKLVGLAPMAGGTGAAVTVKLTGTVSGVAPVALPVPAAGLRVSHAALSLAVQLKVPLPVLLRLTVWAAGVLPPCCAVKDRLVGVAPIAGGTGAAVTVKLTGTMTGVAPVALRVTAPL